MGSVKIQHRFRYAAKVVGKSCLAAKTFQKLHFDLDSRIANISDMSECDTSLVDELFPSRHVEQDDRTPKKHYSEKELKCLTAKYHPLWMDCLTDLMCTRKMDVVAPILLDGAVRGAINIWCDIADGLKRCTHDAELNHADCGVTELVRNISGDQDVACKFKRSHQLTAS